MNEIIIDRLMRRSVVAPSGCLEWTGSRSGAYGTIKMPGCKSPQYVHRVAYETFVGQIPDGYEVDHLCVNPICWWPFHLEAVTGRENTARSRNPASVSIRTDHCQRGHALDGANADVPADGRRRCRECRQARTRAWNAKRVAA